MRCVDEEITVLFVRGVDLVPEVEEVLDTNVLFSKPDGEAHVFWVGDLTGEEIAERLLGVKVNPDQVPYG